MDMAKILDRALHGAWAVIIVAFVFALVLFPVAFVAAKTANLLFGF